jgi:aspartate carbamoyltransferase regulatory subunit
MRISEESGGPVRGIGMSSGEELLVRKIRDGTVIDHIEAGHALDVLRILGITGKKGSTVSIAINIPSGRLGRKDIVKVEGRELEQREVDKIALIAPKATINLIQNFKVTRKEGVKLPPKIVGIVKCTNPSCVSNCKEPILHSFIVESAEPLRLRCYYCNRIAEKEDVLKQF